MASTATTQQEGQKGLIATSGLELLTFVTPNGHKAAILLEELREAYVLQYTCQSINLYAGEQKASWFTDVNPNGKVPVLVDHDKDGHAIFESLAIFTYLVRHYDVKKELWFEDELEISQAEQWLSWQQGSLGPTQAQANFFYRFCSTRHPFPTLRFVDETIRLYGILNAHLKGRDYVAGRNGGKYSVADIAIWPFINAAGVAGIEFERFPNLYEWWERIGERPAVRSGTKGPSGEDFPRGYAKMKREREINGESEEDRVLRKALEKARKEFGGV